MPHAHRLRAIPKNDGKKPVTAKLTEERVHLLEQHATLEAIGHRDWPVCRCAVAVELQRMKRRP